MTPARHTPVPYDGLVLDLAAAQQAALADDHVPPDDGARWQPRRRAPGNALKFTCYNDKLECMEPTVWVVPT